MSQREIYAALVILIMAGATFALRLAPFLAFGRRKEGGVPKWVTYLGNYLLPAVIALLVVYCLRSIDLFSASHGLPELLCVAVCALLHLWRRNELLSIFGSTALYMLLVQVVFP